RLFARRPGPEISRAGGYEGPDGRNTQGTRLGQRRLVATASEDRRTLRCRRRGAGLATQGLLCTVPPALAAVRPVARGQRILSDHRQDGDPGNAVRSGPDLPLHGRSRADAGAGPSRDPANGRVGTQPGQPEAGPGVAWTAVHEPQVSRRIDGDVTGGRPQTDL